MPLVWPAGAPSKVDRTAFKVAPAARGLLKSPMQSGKVRMRRQFTKRITTVQVVIPMTAGQLGVFEAFLYTDLGWGAAEFTMPVWILRTLSYQDRTVQIRDGAEGVTIERWAVDKVRVSFALDVVDY